jgi:hypothetical protein
MDVEEKDRRLRIELSRQLLHKKLTHMPDREIMWMQTELLSEINLSLAMLVDLLQQANANLPR